MNTALADLIFWIIVFVAMFFGFKLLQKRKRSDDTKKDD